MSWLDKYKGENNARIYLHALYFSMTTMTTVGYGDLSGVNVMEYGVSIGCTLVGAMTYIIGTGSMSTVMSNYDQANANMNEKLSVLNRIYREFYLPLELYQKLR